MKIVRLCAVLALGVAFALAFADASENKEPKEAKCCVKAEKNGEKCDHVCCLEAAKESKHCEKCGGKN